MIPIYYDGTTGLQGNGLGALRDAIYCTVTEERNGSYELEMQYPITGQHYDSLAMRGLVKAKPNPYSEAQYFRIYKISRPINGLVTINAQHISYDLSGVPVAPFTASTAALAMERLKTNAAVDCSFTIWTDLSTAAEFANAKPASLRSLLGGVDGSILDVYGGEYEWDNYTVKLHARRGADRGVTIRYGKNLTDLTQEENCANVYTGVYPYWVDDEGGVVQISGVPIVNVPDGQYDFTRIMTLDVSQDYNEQPTDDQLKQAALDYIKANDIGVPKVSLSISFAQLEQTEEYKGKALLERVCLCDTVHVSFERLGVDATALVIKTTYNVLLDRYDSVELGSAKSTLAGTVASLGKDTKTEIDKTKSMLQEAIDRATQLITGNLGGYVILHSSTGSDAPDEILVMDQPDINTATKVWRWNLSGWGYSATGYGGPYRLAATMEGAINADFVTIGTLAADLIKAGILQDKTGKVFFLDLDKGILRLNASSVTQGGKELETVEDGDIKRGELEAAIELKVSKTYATNESVSSLISQSAAEIKLEVSKTYATTESVQGSVETARKEAAAAQAQADKANSDAQAAQEAADAAKAAADQAAADAAQAEKNAADDATAKAAAAEAAAKKAAEADATAKAAAAEAAAKTAAAEDAKAKADAAQKAAQDYTDNKLSDYSDTATVKSLISQSADAIKLEVSKTYATTEIVQSQISASADAIELKVSQTYATNESVSSKISQGISSITLEVENNGTSSSLTLKAGETVLSSNSVVISGFLTVGNLTDGTTTISGDNIKTGKISADRIDVDNIKVNSLYAGSTPIIYSLGSMLYIGSGAYQGVITAYSVTCGGSITCSDLKASYKIQGGSLDVGGGSATCGALTCSSLQVGYNSMTRQGAPYFSTSGATVSSCATAISNLISQLKNTGWLY